MLRFSQVSRVAAVAFIGGMLAACGTGPSSDDSLTMNILYGGRPTPPPVAPKREITCPYVEVLEGTVAYRAGGEGARNVAYQSALTNVARECSDDGVTLRIRVGVQGRTILGEGGKPGTFTAPVRVAVRKGDKTVYSRLMPTSVSVPADGHGVFQVIDEAISLPIGADDPGDEYRILVGLDPQGARNAPRNRRR